MNNYSEKFEKMRKAGSLASSTLDMITDYIKPGLSTNKIDELCYEFIKDNGGHSAPLYYRGFNKSICTSLNHVVCHGIPGERVLEDGDILNIDVTAILHNHYGDTSRMFTVGKPSVKSMNLINVTYESLMKSIEILKPGKKLGDIGHEIQTHVEKAGFSVVRDFCGHGIGDVMINAGKYEVKILNDGWTAVTKDKALSAQFEHTVGITDNGYEIFTESVKNLKRPPYN